MKTKEKVSVNNVAVGDMFRMGKHGVAQVVDIYEILSMTTGDFIDNQCVAQMVDGLSTNKFTVPFSTVVRGRINAG